MTADVKLLADMDALVAWMTDKTETMPMPEVCDIPGTMRRGADALRRYVQGADSEDAARYRYIRAKLVAGESIELVPTPNLYPWPARNNDPAKIDAAIDEARALISEGD